MVLVEHVTWCRRWGGGGSSVKSFHHSEVGSAGTEVNGERSGRREIGATSGFGLCSSVSGP